MEILKNLEDINLNLISLKTINFYDEIIENNIQRFKIRYHLNKIFGFNAWCNLSIIKYKEFENIDTNEDERKKVKHKAYIFRNINTNLKVLLIDLENNSPYQITFYNFCKKCLDNNPFINMLIFHNIGKNNHDEEFYKNINNNPKINMPNLSQILYENNTEEKIEININSFFNWFFDCSKFMLYEGYDSSKNLIYFNATLEKIQEHELNRIFLNQNEIYLFNLKYENIQIKYKRNDNHLIIKSNNKMLEEYVCYKPLIFFSSIIQNLKNLKKLTISGFNYKISEINNPKINILSINALNSFSVDNCVSKTNKFDFNDNFEKFVKLKYLIISGYLDELAKYITIKNLKKIKFYAKDYNESKVKKIEIKYKKKNIILEIIDSKKTNNKYENEEEIEKEYCEKEDNDDDDEEKNKNKNKIIINMPKPKIIKENNDFDSDILVEEEQKKFLLRFFSKKKNFKRVYSSWCSIDDRVSSLYWKFVNVFNSSSVLFIIETKQGNIFGFFLKKKMDYKSNNNFLFNILTQEVIYDDNLEIEYYYKDKFTVRNHFYLVNGFLYSYNNKFFSNKLKMNERKFTCRLLEIFSISS